jgi:hypothetical protein
MLVVGARGAGKSFWWQALLSDAARATLQTPSLNRGILKVYDGWSEHGSPDKDTFAALRRDRIDARQIWRSVLLALLVPEVRQIETWRQRVEWVVTDPERVARHLRECDDNAASMKTRHLVVFDALDRTADDWTERRALLKGLLQLVLDLRSTRAIRAKVFVRPDMVQDPEVLAFVDASKVIGSRVELTWPRSELYGLLWQYMGKPTRALRRFAVGRVGSKT